MAALNPSAFASPQPAEQQHWNICFERERCWFGHHGGAAYGFVREGFERDGVIPHPSLSP
ncbi:MAG: hypothetical protein OIF38_01485 [Cellvibrionaceae bacterium]|nr:hypothetical protein [Cellvibrionaceae bacterium]